MTYLSKDVFLSTLPDTLDLLKDLVQIESPSTDKTAVDQLGARLISLLTDLDAETEVFERERAGNLVLARWGSGPGGILILCHMDTVFQLGTTDQRPYRQEDHKAFGPGALDMKAGIAMIIHTLRLFRREGVWPEQPLSILFTSDEEIGSLNSRQVIEDTARQMDIVLCLEPGLSNGALKTARKGTGFITLHARGVAAHAGADHERGRNAIEELAHHILAAQRLTDYQNGTTVNVGVVQGGTRTNVVPEEAQAWVDFRVTNQAEVTRLEQWARNLKPAIAGAKITAKFSVNRPPMPRDETMARTFAKAQSIAHQMGIELAEGSTGGGSDANFVAALGVPVLDGLGAIGEGAHSDREYVLIRSIPEREALLSALILNWK